MLRGSEKGSRDSKKPSSAVSALVAVARRLGVDTSANELQRRFALDSGEPSSKTVAAIANELGLQAKIARLRFKDLPRLAKVLPAVIRSIDGSALVLEAARIDEKSGLIAVLRDPTANDDALVTLDEAQMAKIWAGEIVLIKRHFSVSDDEQPFGMGWFIAQIVREKKVFVDIAAAAIVSTAFALAPPFMIMIVVNRVLLHQSLSTLNVLAAALAFIVISEMVLGHLRRALTQVASTRLDGRINLYIVDKLLKLPMDYFERNSTGAILSKLHRVTYVRQMLTGQIFGAILDAVPLIGLLPAMFILEWKLTFISLIMAAIVFVIVLVFMEPISKRVRRVVNTENRKSSHLVETIYGMRTIKSLALEGRRRREWDALVADATLARHDLGVVSNYPQTLSLPFDRMIYVGSVIIGAYFILAASDPINAGALIAFSMLAGRLAAPLIKIAHLQNDLAELRSSVSEIASVLNREPEDSRQNSGLRLPIEGEISFKDVRFRYSTDAPHALDGVTFSVPRGKMLGIMGRSGSGKTTVTRLLQRLHTNYDGLIKLDGMDLREINLGHLRSSIGVVAQENFLFSGSIRDNISMARPSASFDQIVRAAQVAGAEEFIERLPRGYDTLLEEGAVNLSGGQRQRLAIARALLIDPPLLILDEATSALDAESEAIINANLRRIAKGRTVVAISHRLSMLVEADAILVLERGKVYDIGTHEELLQRCDIYKHLWHQQNRHLDRGAADAPLAMLGST